MPELIAEIGQAHDGSLGLAHSYIDALASTGVHSIKFQMHIAEAESSAAEPFRVNFSYEDKTRFDYWQRMEFSFDQWCGLKNHCEDKGLEFLVSPFSLAAVEILERLGVARYKIGSGEIKNLLLLERIAQTGKPVILSSGLSSYNDLDATAEFLNHRGVSFSILQCTTNYPTSPEVIGLNVIQELETRYKVPSGLSDHSGSIFPCLAATALGASILEFHAVFDRESFGPDAKSSLTMNEIRQVAEGASMIAAMVNSPVDKSSLHYDQSLQVMFGKSLAVNKSRDAGDVIKFDDLESKKPGDIGIPAAEFSNVIGKKLLNAKKKWDFLYANDIES